MSRNFVLACEIPFNIAIVVNLPGIRIQVTATHASSHIIEAEYRVPQTTSFLVFVALYAPEPMQLPFCAVKAPLPVFPIPWVIFSQE